MLTFQPQRLILIAFMLLGFGYFSLMSQWEINYFLKCLIAVLPIQIAAIIYINRWRWHRR